MKVKLKWMAAALCGVVSVTAQAAVLFSEDFSDLDAWTRGSPSFATVSGGVLSFTSSKGAGDIYLTQTFSNVWVNFEYRGSVGYTGGGYVGFSEAYPGNHVWLAGAADGTYQATTTKLVDDGQWHSYSIQYTGDAGHLMLEQYDDGTGGTALFRNLSVSTSAMNAVDAMPSSIPEPESAAMLLAGLGVLGAAGRRRRAVTRA